MDTCGLWSTLTFPTLILPSYSFDNSSMTGPIARQGPHHSAQKSTMVNLSEEITLSWKLVSVNSKAMIECFLCYMMYFLLFEDPTIWSLFGSRKRQSTKILDYLHFFFVSRQP